ncbi:phage tail terminator family protein [Bacillus horti]|uniref:DUF5072 domain-containing protein n=1 Tax=Caldalkalibacillus horti TaxID=77523 RepID=A0ABT9W054_9BACI|nr:hypothetical protein [Bacillus horti]MDQ0166633.1 hypothetical protein [Bacillus horti]
MEKMDEEQLLQSEGGVQAIIDHVAATLRRHFPDLAVLEDEPDEDAPEGVPATPYFLVLLDKVTHTQELGHRYFRQHNVLLQYVKSEAKNRDLHQMAEKLYDYMETISAGADQYKGSSMEHEVKEGVLHFSVEYSSYVVRQREPVPKMQQIEQEGYVHG